MRKFFENKFAFAATVLAFATAMALNAAYGMESTLDSRWNAPKTVLLASGPTMPPDPWQDGSLAMSGPTMPPDPWQDALLAMSGPTMPPDPWQDGGLAMSGPTMPPDPWQD